MKRLIALISLGFLIISVCMVYLVKNGISLRPATLIKPSVAEKDLKNVAQGLLVRMYPEFEKSHYIVWGIAPGAETSQLLGMIQQDYEKMFHLNVHVLGGAETLSFEQIKDCAKPCWLLTTPEHANELNENSFITKTVRTQGHPYANVSMLSFALNEKAPEHCLREKRLTLPCLKSLSAQAAQRKIKTPERYFFLKKYNNNDFFLFLQESLK